MASVSRDHEILQYLLVELQGTRTVILGWLSSVFGLLATGLVIYSNWGIVLGLVLAAMAFVPFLLALSYSRYLDTVKFTVKAHITGTLNTDLNTALVNLVYPREVRITSVGGESVVLRWIRRLRE